MNKNPEKNFGAPPCIRDGRFQMAVKSGHVYFYYSKSQTSCQNVDAGKQKIILTWLPSIHAFYLKSTIYAVFCQTAYKNAS